MSLIFTRDSEVEQVSMFDWYTVNWSVCLLFYYEESDYIIMHNAGNEIICPTFCWETACSSINVAEGIIQDKVLSLYG